MLPGGSLLLLKVPSMSAASVTLLSCLACLAIGDVTSLATSLPGGGDGTHATNSLPLVEDYLQDTVPATFDLVAWDPKQQRDQHSQVRLARQEFQEKVSDALASPQHLTVTQQNQVKQWMQRVVLAEMTSLNNDSLTQLGKLRTNLFRDYVDKASRTNRLFLVDQVIVPKAITIARGDYHPAVRVNSIQILNWLDLQPGVSGSQYPEPSRRALAGLISLATDPQSPDYVVAIAMVGLQRQADLHSQVPPSSRMSAEMQMQVLQTSLQILNRFQDSENDQQPGYMISRRAVQTIGALSHWELPKPTPVNHQLQNIVDNGDAGVWLRMDALAVLAQLPNEDPDLLLQQVGRLIVQIVRQEQESLLAFQNRLAWEQQIAAKTGSGRNKRNTSPDRMADLGNSQGNTSAKLEVGNGKKDASSAGGRWGQLDHGTLLPYHLHYLRTNIKQVTLAARGILGTQPKTDKGIRFLPAVRQRPATMELIQAIDDQLVALQHDTDLGLVEEKVLSQREKSQLSNIELQLLSAPVTLRMLHQIDTRVETLEMLSTSLGNQNQRADVLTTAPGH